MREVKLKLRVVVDEDDDAPVGDELLIATIVNRLEATVMRVGKLRYAIIDEVEVEDG